MAEKKSILLRLPPELWAEIKRFADAELRSVNGQIEFILREAIMKRTGKLDEDEANETEGE